MLPIDLAERTDETQILQCCCYRGQNYSCFLQAFIFFLLRMFFVFNLSMKRFCCCCNCFCRCCNLSMKRSHEKTMSLLQHLGFKSKGKRLDILVGKFVKLRGVILASPYVFPRVLSTQINTPLVH